MHAESAAGSAVGHAGTTAPEEDEEELVLPPEDEVPVEPEDEVPVEPDDEVAVEPEDEVPVDPDDEATCPDELVPVAVTPPPDPPPPMVVTVDPPQATPDAPSARTPVIIHPENEVHRFAMSHLLRRTPCGGPRKESLSTNEAKS